MRGCDADVAAPHVYEISLPCSSCRVLAGHADIGSNVSPRSGCTYATNFYWDAATEWIGNARMTRAQKGLSEVDAGCVTVAGGRC